MADTNAPWWLRLDWADRCFDDLKASVEAFGKRHPCEVLSNRDLETGDYVFRLKVHEEPPLDWGFLIGDFINNVRCAVDNLVWEIARRNADPPPDRTQFLACFDHATFEKRRHSLAGLPDAAFYTIKMVQPYQDRYAYWGQWRQVNPAESPAYILERLWNWDKHRASHPAFFALGRETVWFNLHTVPEEASIEPHSFNVEPLHDNDEIARARVIPNDARVDLDANFTIEIGFGERSPIPGAPVMQTLIELRRFVREEVFPLLVPFL